MQQEDNREPQPQTLSQACACLGRLRSSLSQEFMCSAHKEFGVRHAAGRKEGLRSDAVLSLRLPGSHCTCNPQSAHRGPASIHLSHRFIHPSIHGCLSACCLAGCLPGRLSAWLDGWLSVCSAFSWCLYVHVCIHAYMSVCMSV